jgi:putative SOS response-associated peptidase YedK
MCGRATLSSPAEDVADLFEVEPIDIGPARFNIAPTQPILTVRAQRPSATEPTKPHEESESDGARREHEGDAVHHDLPGGTPVARELALVRWGLIPWWAKPDEAKRISSKCIQARAETAPRSPAFRDAFRRHRCLVVVDGFFEWKTLPDGRRVPHHVRQSGRQPFAIAGLWDEWRPPLPEGAPAGVPPPARLESCAVLTTRSAGAIRELHDRMPLVLPANEWDAWLGGSVEEATRLLEHEQAPDVLDERAHELVAVPVSTWVNDVRHDDPRCIDPAPLVSVELGSGQIDFGFSDTPPRTRRRKR